MFTTAEFLAHGTRSKLRWGQATGRWTCLIHGVFGEGSDPPTALDIALARLHKTKSPAWGCVAGVLFNLDGVTLSSLPQRRATQPVDSEILVVSGVPCTSALQTLVDLAETLSDDEWEQALESALRLRLVDVPEIVALLPAMSASRRHGVGRIRRVLAVRPPDAPPTESLLETLMVQLTRLVPNLPPPTRQYRVVDVYGNEIARVDLCWPELGIFLELDGMQHLGQPKYDARRQTRVIAATGWLCGRFTWDEVVRNQRVTVAALTALVAQARARTRVPTV